MEIGTKSLMDFLLEFNRYLPRKTKIIALGGTALTLLRKKASTRDIDFCFVNENEKKTFVKTLQTIGYQLVVPNKLVGHGVAIDVYSDGYIFCVQLPPDYKEKAMKIREMGKIELYILSPVDLIITKAARFNDRDREDLIVLLESYKIDQEELLRRWIEVMENSMVKDAKENIILLFSLLEKCQTVDPDTLREAQRWANE